MVCCFILHNLCIALSDDSFAIEKPAVIAEEEDDDHDCSEDSSEDQRVLVLQRTGFAYSPNIKNLKNMVFLKLESLRTLDKFEI